MMLSLFPRQGNIYVPLNQAALGLPEMVDKHDVHDRGTDPLHKPYIAARINCSHSSLTAAAAFLSNVLSLLGG